MSESRLTAAPALLLAVVLVAAVALAAWAGFAFYAPQVGELAGGRQGETGGETGTAGRSLPRDRARVEVAAYMAGGAEGGGTGGAEARPTLAQVFEFFALEEDTWACAVAENYGQAAAERAAQYARRPLRVGDEIVLCLD